jgi:hypothetical protein
MGRTKRELLDAMDAAELQDWIALQERDPFTSDRADLRAGIIAAVIANVNSSRRTFRPSDFMPEFGPPQEQTDEDIRAVAIRANAMFGGTFR